MNNNLLNKRYLTLIIKVTHKCNFNCPYCYDKKNRHIHIDMDFSLIKEILNKVGKGVIKEWTWHGGEPMLKGIDYYEKQNKIIKDFDPGIRLLMQTNGSLVNEEWIKHFKKWKVGVGFSFDGLDNDNTRGHTKLILDNINLMKEHGENVGQILVITKNNINRLTEEYEYQKQLHLSQQWNFIFQQDGNDNTYNLTGEELYKNMVDLFNYYISDKNNPVESPVISYYLGLLLNTSYTKCDQYHCTGKWMQIDTVGDIYPCGRDWTSDMLYGNIYKIEKITDVYKNDNFKQFLTGSMKVLNYCKNCKWFYQCHGGCYQNAYNYWGRNFEKPEPNYCYFMQHYLQYLYDFLHNKLDINYIDKYNPYFISTLYKYGFRSEKLLKTFLQIGDE